MPLSHFSLQKAKPADKPYKISDGGGLFVLIQPNGSKLWRMKYQLLGIERSLSFGSYPAISLADARMNRDEARKLLATGTDPSTQKKHDKLAAETAAKCTFAHVAAEHIANLEANGSAASTIQKNRWVREDFAKPIAARPIADITAAELLDLLKRIEKSGRRETARRLRTVMGAVLRLAAVNPARTQRSDLCPQGGLAAAQYQTPRGNHRRDDIRRPVAQPGRTQRLADDPCSAFVFRPDLRPPRRGARCQARRIQL